MRSHLSGWSLNPTSSRDTLADQERTFDEISILREKLKGLLLGHRSTTLCSGLSAL